MNQRLISRRASALEMGSPYRVDETQRFRRLERRHNQWQLGPTMPHAEVPRSRTLGEMLVMKLDLVICARSRVQSHQLKMISSRVAGFHTKVSLWALLGSNCGPGSATSAV